MNLCLVNYAGVARLATTFDSLQLMSVNRTPELMAELGRLYDEFLEAINGGMRSLRAQWDIEGHDEPLTLFANRQGVFIVEPGAPPVPAGEWLVQETADHA